VKFKTPTTAETTSAIRKRHNLAEDVPIMLKSMPIEVSGDDDYLVSARITTDTLDADNEAVLPSGCDSSRFEKSGAIFAWHDYTLPVATPIGKLRRGDRFIDATCRFPVRPADYVGEFFPDYIRTLVKQKVIRGVSIGFVPREVRMPTYKDIERWGQSLSRVVSKWQLLEWSFAALQSNPDAMVVEGVRKGIIAATVAREFFGVTIEDEEPPAPTLAIIEPEPDPEPLVECKEIAETDPELKDFIDLTAWAMIEKKRGRLFLRDPNEPDYECDPLLTEAVEAFCAKRAAQRAVQK
jgi:hypothetical protein